MTRRVSLALLCCRLCCRRVRGLGVALLNAGGDVLGVVHPRCHPSGERRN
jgi:hypothetical protein